MLRISLLLILFTVPAAAQSGAGSFGGNADEAFGEAHLGSLTGAFGRSVAGELTGDLRTDVVLLVGDQPVLAYGPGVFRALVNYPLSANDLCVMHSDTPGQLDALALVSSRGLEVWHSSANGSFGMSSLGSTAWTDAKAVRSADIDGSGAVDLVGLTADSQTLMRVLDPGAGGAEKLLAVPGTVYTFTLVNWDGGSDVELAAVTSMGFYVIDYNGNVVFSGPGGSPTDVLITLPDAGAGYERLVCATILGGNDVLVVRDQMGMEVPLSLGNLGIVGLAAGDLDGDGLPDIVVSQKATKDLLALSNRGLGSSTFGTGMGEFEIISIDDSGPAPGNEAWPSVFDADQDGDLDVFAAVESLGAVCLKRNGIQDHTEAAASLVAGSYDYDEPLLQGTLTLTVAPPVTLGFTPDAIEVVVWRQASPSAATAGTALFRSIVPYAGVGDADVSVILNDSIESYSIHDVEVRFIATDATGEPVQASGTRNFATATRVSAITLFASLNGVALASIVSLPLSGYSYSGGHVSDIGVGVAPLGDIPDFSAGVLPDPWL